MLKYKSHTFASIADGVEDLTDMLAGMSGKNRRVVALLGEVTADQDFRVYRDGDQIIDLPCARVPVQAPILPCDISLAEGQLLKVGYYNHTGGASTTQEIVVGYEETD